MGQHVGKRNHGMDTPENNRQRYYSFLLNVHESLTRTVYFLGKYWSEGEFVADGWKK